MNRNIKIKVGVPPIWIVKSNVGPLIIVSSPTILYFNFFLDTALKHKIVMQSQTISDGSGKLNLVHVSRSTQTVSGSLRSLRVYVNKIGDCLPRFYVN